MNKLLSPILAFVSLSLACTSTSAQYGPIDDKTKFQVSIGYGVVSTDQVFDGYMSHYSTPVPYTYYQNTTTGPLSISGKYKLSNKFSLGFTFAYERDGGDWMAVIDMGGIDDFRYDNAGRYKRQTFTLAPEVTFTYKTSANGLFSMYCLLGIGATYENEVDMFSESYYNAHYTNGVNSLGSDMQVNNNRTHFNMQASQGFKFGRKAGGYLEAGMGYKGMVNAGLFVKM